MLSRRTFLGSAAACAAAAGAAQPAERLKLREFGYSQVTLTDGPLAAMYRRMHTHFLKLDEDRVLKVYRQRAGMPAPGRDMGGWYDADGFVPGHLIGQFISGLSRLLRQQWRSAEAAAKAAPGGRVCRHLGTDDNPFASPKASTTWPCYILDKYEIGLLDAANFAGVDAAKPCCRA